VKDGYALCWDSHHVNCTAATAYAKGYSAKEAKAAIILPESHPGNHAQ
jgi:hypothetical protein